MKRGPWDILPDPLNDNVETGVQVNYKLDPMHCPHDGRMITTYPLMCAKCGARVRRAREFEVIGHPTLEERVAKLEKQMRLLDDRDHPGRSDSRTE